MSATMGTPAQIKIVLAPMEGVIDAAMRRFLTAQGGYSRCVTEFIRVTDVLLPERVFMRLCPELENGSVTQSGVPVYCQLLGSKPDAMAVNARRAVTLGAAGVDQNFGCPAKTVNNSMGGSVLLQYPQLVGDIVRSVRDAVPPCTPVTAKIRLGYASKDLLEEIVSEIRHAGATELAIHARTKFDGYKPPARWSSVRKVTHEGWNNTYINGEIWTVEDSVRARTQSGCQHVMLGRGALASPDLAERIRRAADGERVSQMPWSTVCEQVERQFLECDSQSPRHVGNRTKQWLAYLKRAYPQASDLFTRMRTLHDVPGISQAFAAHRRSQCQPDNRPRGHLQI